MNAHDTAHDHRHDRASRNPMVWLVVGLPALVMVAAFATLAIAIRAGGSDALPDDVRRMAQIQTADLDADAYAAAQKLSAVLSVGENAIDILPVSGDALQDDGLRKQPLILLLQHPSRAAEDRRLQLRPSAHGWHVASELDRSHDWRIRLSAADARWRLHGRLPKTIRATLLQPALAAQTPSAGDTAMATLQP